MTNDNNTPGGLRLFLEKRPYEVWIFRLIIAFIMVCCGEILYLKQSFQSFSYFLSINLLLHIAAVIGVFALLMLINKSWLDGSCFFAFSLVYCFVAVRDQRDLYFSIACCLILGGVVLYAVRGREQPLEALRLGNRVTYGTLAVLAGLFIAFVGGLTSILYLAHYASCYDFGIFAQMFTYMKETLLPYATCERDQLLSHFAVHFSPIYYLLLPFFCLFPTPVTLLIGQAVVLASGVIPLFLLCRHFKLSNVTGVAISALYVLLPSTISGCFFYLHENKFLTPLLLWLFYWVEKNKLVPTIVFAFLVMIVKEDAPVYVAILALYLLLSRTDIKKGALLMALSVLYFLFVTHYLANYGDGVMNYRYENYIYDESDSLFTVIKAVILNPIYVFAQSFTEEKFRFVLQMLVPLAFLPLMIKRPSRIILLFPFLLINLMSNYYYQHDIGYQYTYGPAAFFFYLLVLNYPLINAAFRERALLIALCSSVILFAGLQSSRLSFVWQYRNHYQTYQAIDTALDLIPKDASVMATTFLVPALFDHMLLYEMETTTQETEYIAIDLRFPNSKIDPDDYFNGDYEVVEHIEGAVAIFRRAQ
ncbi:DUF2079 domain-containing protein [Ruminococcaceae bacterium OttesenSCG-928-L11]|nr:DUF2079 domain-containing protein [Ruminococcaceae bacterium OttesenSCG-928-L11]